METEPVLITNEGLIICGDSDVVTQEELREADAKIRKQGERDAVIERVKKTGKRLPSMTTCIASTSCYDCICILREHINSIEELLALD